MFNCTQFLLDANVISEFMKTKGHANESVKRFVMNQPFRNLHISAVTVGELAKGAYNLPAGSDFRNEFLDYAEYIEKRFKKSTIDFDTEVSKTWGRIMAEYIPEKEKNLRDMDSVIAACAVHHDFTILTRNVKHFKHITELNIINPWDEVLKHNPFEQEPRFYLDDLVR